MQKIFYLSPVLWVGFFSSTHAFAQGTTQAPTTKPVFSQASSQQTSSSQSGFVTGGQEISLGNNFTNPQSSATMNNEGAMAYQGASPVAMTGKNRTFKLTPFIGTDVTYSDNINLTKNNKKSGIISNTYGGVRGDLVTNRLNAAGTAGASMTYSPNSDRKGVDLAPFVEAGATAEIVRNHLFVDALANYTALYNTGRGRSQTGAGVGDMDGFGEVSVSPYWRQKLGNIAVSELRYGYNRGFSSADNVGDIQTHSYQAMVGTGDRFNRVSLRGRVAHADSTYDAVSYGRESDFKQTTADLTTAYGISRTLNLLGVVGYDKVSGSDTDADEFTGEYIAGGAEYMPNQRTRLMGLVGRRYNDLFYMAEGNYQVSKAVYMGATAMTTLQPPSGYNQQRSVTLAGQQLSDFNKFLKDNNNISVAEAIRLKYNLKDGQAIRGADGNMMIIGNDHNLSGFKSQYAGLYTGFNKGRWSGSVSLGQDVRDYNRTSDETARIATAGLGYQINQKWSLFSDAFFYGLDSSYEPLNADMYGGSVGVNYALTRNVNTYVALRRTEREGALSEYDYTENAITAGISASF